MKKASKLLMALLVVLLAGVLAIGCSDAGDEIGNGGYKNPSASSTTLKTYYIKVLDSSRESPFNDLNGIGRLHFHSPEGTGFKIQYVFVSNAMEDGVPADAAVWYDFTKGSDPGDYETGSYGGWLFTGAGGINNGVWTLDNSLGTVADEYPGNMGLALDGAAYIGFVIANYSNTVKFDDVLLEFHKGGDPFWPSKPCSYFFGFSN
jgi:hypothetical protein